jgi:uncharacterized protein (DUF362 family)
MGNNMSIVLIQNQKDKAIKDVLFYLLDSAGQRHWLDGLINKNNVVIKPNLCYLASWESGITTNVELIEGLIQYIRKINPKLKITVVESDNNDRSGDDAFDQLGYSALKEKYDVEILNLTKEPCQEVIVPDLHYSIKVPEIFFQDVFFISVANLKVHLYQKMTGIYKNQFGCVPDEIKERYHQYLEETLYALNKMIRPDISIIDGKVGLEGIGPVTGTPRKSEIMMLSNDPAAMDTIAAKVMGLNPKEVPHLAYIYKKDKINPEDYKVHGTNTLPVFNFKTDKSFKLIRTKINITRQTDHMNKSFKNFTTWVYNIPSFTKRAYGFGKRKLRKVVGK